MQEWVLNINLGSRTYFKSKRHVELAQKQVPELKVQKTGIQGCCGRGSKVWRPQQPQVGLWCISTGLQTRSVWVGHLIKLCDSGRRFYLSDVSLFILSFTFLLLPKSLQVWVGDTGTACSLWALLSNPTFTSIPDSSSRSQCQFCPSFLLKFFTVSSLATGWGPDLLV